MKNYLFLLLSLFCINAYSQKNSGIFYSTLFTKEGVYLRNDDFGNNAVYVETETPIPVEMLASYFKRLFKNNKKDGDK